MLDNARWLASRFVAAILTYLRDGVRLCAHILESNLPEEESSFALPQLQVGTVTSK